MPTPSASTPPLDSVSASAISRRPYPGSLSHRLRGAREAKITKIVASQYQEA